MVRKQMIVGGQICLDLVPAMLPEAGTDLKEMIAPGRIIPMDGMELFIGGGAGNTALAVAALGGRAVLAGKVGDDRAGRIVREILSEQPVTDAVVTEPGERTSYSISVTPAGVDRRTCFHCEGASNLFRLEDVDWDAYPEAVLYHFGYPTIIRTMYENDGEELERMMKAAKARGLATSLDLCPIHEGDGAGACDWDRILQRSLPYVDFFMPSVEEMLMLFEPARRLELRTEAERTGKDITELVSLKNDVEPLADLAIRYGAGIVLIKCGVPGVYIRTAGRERLAGVGERLELPAEEWADLAWFERSYRPERIASGMGCGDSTIGAFLLSVMEGKGPREAMELALGTGALCVAAYDTLSGLLPLPLCLEKIRSGWEKTDREMNP